MMIKFLISFFLICLGNQSLAIAQVISLFDNPCPLKTVFELFKKKDSILIVKPIKNSFLLVIPVIGVQPATGFSYGATGQYTFKGKEISDKYSSANLGVTFTTKKQLLINAKNSNPDIQIHLLDGMADEVLEASDVVLIASGTATLQAALWKKPMVISYKVPWLTAQIMKRQGYLPYVGLPNILCGEFVVPEFLQDSATPKNLAAALQDWLNHPMKVAKLQERFAQLHETLRRPTGLLVAQAVAQTIANQRIGKASA